jgi:hypothetical protein
MPSGGDIDYSKWDHLEDYSDDDDDEEVTTSSTPRVTRLDAPSQVTFGGGAATLQTSSKQQQQTVTTTSAITPAASSTKASGTSDDDNTWTQKGGQATIPSLNRQVYWTQDRYSATLRLELFDGKVTNVKVEGVLPYADRHAAVGSTKPRLQILLDDNNVLYEGDLPHPVHLAQEDEDIDWSFERRQGNRFVVTTLYKAVPMQGLTVWWKRPLMEVPEIEMENEKPGASQEFLQAWEEAHRMFREKKREPPTKLDI